MESLAFGQDRTNPTESCGSGNLQFIEIVLQPSSNCGTAQGQPYGLWGRKAWGISQFLGNPGFCCDSWKNNPFGRCFFPSVSHFIPEQVNQLWAALLSFSMGQRDAWAQISEFWVDGAVGGLGGGLCPAASVLESIGKMLGDTKTLTCSSR